MKEFINHIQKICFTEKRAACFSGRHMPNLDHGDHFLHPKENFGVVQTRPI
jgi:hypothetical protein